MPDFHVAAFYKFTPLAALLELQPRLLRVLEENRIKGSVLLAGEGINGTIAGAEPDLHAALQSIRLATGIVDLEPKFSSARTMPFKRLKVRLKKEIVTIGETGADPNKLVGTYVEPEDWNKLISDPDVVVIDTRNSYEVAIGTFRNAIDPQTESFGEFPAFVRQRLAAAKSTRIAMFCTGGIRCEKATSFMKHEGFENVYHLKGGILKYLETMPREQSLWQGDCFVFDERVAVGHGLELSNATMCYGCLEPVTELDRSSPLYEEGVCCPRCASRLTETQKSSNRERQRQVELALKRGRKHLGPE